MTEDGAAPSGTDLPVKEPVGGACPACGAEELAAYPVLGAGGWFQVVKCQRCLHSVSRVPWNRLGWIGLEEDML
jgi:vanillate/4-hydroxybenzoate decarboxylase subunit D